MNPEQLLQEVETLIKNRTCSPHVSCHICICCFKLSCMPVNHTRVPHTIFMVLTPLMLNEGLSTHNWDNLLHKLTNYYKEKI